MTTHYRQNLDVAWRRITGRDKAILVLPLVSHVFGLNEVATRAWELLEQWTTREELCAALLEEFEVEALELSTDLDALLQSLAERDLLEARQEGGGAERVEP